MSHYIKHPDAIFKTISEPFTDPGKFFNNVGETLYNANPFVAVPKFIGDTLGNFSQGAKTYFEPPTWDQLQKPAQAFSQQIDAKNSILPSVLRPYAQPLEEAALSAFNPLIGAAYQTAYQAGQNQAQPGAFDWGRLGKDAAINFGTAGLQIGAKDLISSANAANTAKAATANFSPGSLEGAYNPAIPGTTAGFSGYASAPNALASFNPTSDALNLASSGASSAANFPVTSASQAPAGQGLYKAGVQAGQGLGSNALGSTLAPQGAQPISGTMDNFQTTSGQSSQPTLQWGDLLNAFGGPTSPNPGGPRYDENAVNGIVQRLGANTYLQQNQARDNYLPTGQFQASQNSPYGNRISQINHGADQSYKDLIDQVNNANSYYGVIDANPGLTSDDLNKYLQDPSTGVLGNFNVPQASVPYLQNIRPLSPLNNSLLH